MTLEVFTNQTFEDLNCLDPRIVSQLKFLQFEKCTPVQALAIAPISSGNDTLVRSPTGSGKTLAFCAPLVHRLLNSTQLKSRSSGVFAIVLSPSKELCLQTQNVLMKLIRMLPHIVVGSLAGGDNPKKEKARLRKGVNILCGTPGRVLYHLQNTASLDFSAVELFVLDEADRLLDLGFEQQIRKIHQKLSRTAQVCLVSATLSPSVRALADWCLKPDAKWLDAVAAASPAPGEDACTTREQFVVPTLLEQSIVECDLKIKVLLLFGALFEARARGLRRIMIFVNSCASADFHVDLVKSLMWPKPPGKNDDHPEVMTTRAIKRGVAHPETYKPVRADEDAEEATSLIFPTSMFSFYKLHGDLCSLDRSGAMSGFTKQSDATKILFCTDVAARGVDITGVDLVIQYDPPQQTEEYLHRVGRTARIGTAGKALIFLLPSEAEYAETIQSMCPAAVIRKIEQESYMDAFTRAYGLSQGADKIARIRELGSFFMACICKYVAANPGMLSIARKAFLSGLRAYRTFAGKDIRKIFDWRKMHSGHLAKNFGVEETPREISQNNKDTTAFKKRPHNLHLRNKTDKKEKRDGSPVLKPKRRRLGMSTASLQNLEFQN